jgi:serine/threonine protein kinase
LKDGKIKIGDFGLVKLLNSNNMARTFAGSPYNMAP